MTNVNHEVEHGLDQLDPKTTEARDAQHFRRIIAARKNLRAAEQELHDAVSAAREAGDSWAVIGAALDTTRQAASQRFGRQSEELSTGATRSRPVGQEGHEKH